jgi:NAD(P)-dependent dehydrogenase (short-subunit alcohol dehydrogenase family)
VGINQSIWRRLGSWRNNRLSHPSNLDGTFLFCHAVVPVMKRRRSGKIVNISSIAGRVVAANSSSAYAAAKGGIIAFTRKLSLELGPFGITVNAIAPSLTLTERLRVRRTPDQIAAEAARTPLGRVAVAEDQARVICFLASRDADFVTGVTIDVSGGQSGDGAPRYALSWPPRLPLPRPARGTPSPSGHGSTGRPAARPYDD